MTLIETLFGSGTDLNALQMSIRAIAVFLLTLSMLRLAGRRSLGMHSAFDACTTVLLGALLSRAVVGASPFIPTISAALVLVVLHRLIAIANIKWPQLEGLISGHHRELFQAGHIDRQAMRQGLITVKDLERAVRDKTGTDDLCAIRRAVLERDGQITVVPKNKT